MKVHKSEDGDWSLREKDGGGNEDSTTLRPEERRDADERVRQVRVGNKIA